MWGRILGAIVVFIALEIFVFANWGEATPISSPGRMSKKFFDHLNSLNFLRGLYHQSIKNKVAYSLPTICK
jgi:hypothetical protein